MDSMERVLDEGAEDFAQALTQVGFSKGEALRFVQRAGPALLRSYEWQTISFGTALPEATTAARELLAGIPGRTLASEVGLPVEKTWAGLREFVPAVLQASQVRRSSRTRPTSGGSVSPLRRAAKYGIAHFDFGFGLSLERLVSGCAPDSQDTFSKHPIFGRLPTLQE